MIRMGASHYQMAIEIILELRRIDCVGVSRSTNILICTEIIEQVIAWVSHVQTQDGMLRTKLEALSNGI